MIASRCSRIVTATIAIQEEIKIKNNSFEKNYFSLLKENNANNEDLNSLSSKGRASEMTQAVLDNENDVETLRILKYKQETQQKRSKGLHYSKRVYPYYYY